MIFNFVSEIRTPPWNWRGMWNWFWF